MGLDSIYGYVAGIGLDAVKDKIKDAAMEDAARKRLIEYLERQQKLNFNCTIEEEIDFEGLAHYIRTDLIEDVKIRFFGNKKERGKAYQTIIAKASYFAQSNTQISKKRATEMVSTSINILRCYYESKMNRELAFYAGRIEDTIIKEVSEQNSQMTCDIAEVKKAVASSALLSVEHNMQLAENGKIDEVGANLSKVIKAVSAMHPLHPYYGFSMKGTNGEMVSIPLSKEAEIKYPSKLSVTAGSVRIGEKDISQLQSCDVLDYSYRHQLPITLESTSVTKFLGDIPDPIQTEAQEIQANKMSLFPPKFPKALPCSISLNGNVFFDYLLLRTKEIMEDGTFLVTNEEQSKRLFDFSFSINRSSRKTDFNIRPLKLTNMERLKYHQFLKEASQGGILTIKILSENTLLAGGSIAPFSVSPTLDLEIEFLEKIKKIEQYFDIMLNIPEQITDDDHQTLNYVYSIIHLGCFSQQWSSFKTEFQLNDNFKATIAETKDAVYMFQYACIAKVELFNQEVSFPIKREFRSARFQNFGRLQEKAQILDVGDRITITFVVDETEPDNTCIDKLVSENDLLSE